ncbi:MAG: tetratricopeptide repeat protein [Thermoplasmata archaeon]|nr:tetratricopeptide repeat protein [Thermoplasmata archaeon]
MYTVQTFDTERFSYTGKKVASILEREMGPSGVHILVRQLEVAGMNPETVGPEDIPSIALALSEAVSFYGRDKARKVFEEMKKLAEKTGISITGEVSGKTIEEQLDMLEAAKNVGDMKTVQAVIEKMPVEWMRGKNPRSMARFLLISGEYHLRTGEKKRALEEVTSARKIYERTGDVEKAVQAVQSMGAVYWRMGEYRKAADVLAEALEKARDVGDPRLEGRIYLSLANVYDEWGKFQDAVEAAKKSMEALEKAGDERSLATLYNNMGVMYARRGLFRHSLEYYERCISVSSEVGYRYMEGWAGFNAAEDLARMRRYDEALEHCRRSEEIFHELNDELGLSGVYMSYAVTHRLKGDMEEAEKYFKKTLEIRERLDMPYRTADALYEAGCFYNQWGKPEKAKEFLKRALDIFLSLGNQERAGEVQAEIVRTKTGGKNRRQQTAGRKD